MFCHVHIKKCSFLTSCVFWCVFLNASSHLCFRKKNCDRKIVISKRRACFLSMSNYTTFHALSHCTNISKEMTSMYGPFAENGPRMPYYRNQGEPVSAARHCTRGHWHYTTLVCMAKKSVADVWLVIECVFYKLLCLYYCRISLRAWIYNYVLLSQFLEHSAFLFLYCCCCCLD